MASLWLNVERDTRLVILLKRNTKCVNNICDNTFKICPKKINNGLSIYYNFMLL